MIQKDFLRKLRTPHFYCRVFFDNKIEVSCFDFVQSDLRKANKVFKKGWDILLELKSVY